MRTDGHAGHCVTDHGNTFGAYEFYKAGRASSVKPIIGIEAYLTPNTHRSERRRVLWGDGGSDDVSGGGAFTHLTMWAENTPGMHNLFRLSSLASPWRATSTSRGWIANCSLATPMD